MYVNVPDSNVKSNEKVKVPLVENTYQVKRIKRSINLRYLHIIYTH
jgi:hypothetical protein